MTPQIQRAIAAGAAVVGLLMAVVGPVMVGRLGAAAQESLAVTSEALGAVAETVEVAASSIGTVRSSLTAVSDAAADLSSTVDATTQVLDEVAALTANEIPESLEAFQDSLPALISVGGAIDGTLRTLSFFGVDYDPERPFDEALGALGQSLDGVPERLRAQSENLEDATTGIQGVVRNTDDIARSIGDLDADLSSTEELLSEYRITTGEAAQLVTEARDDVRLGVLVSQVLLVLFGLAFAAVQLPVLANAEQSGARQTHDGGGSIEPEQLAEGESERLGDKPHEPGETH